MKPPEKLWRFSFCGLYLWISLLLDGSCFGDLTKSLCSTECYYVQKERGVTSRGDDNCTFFYFPADDCNAVTTRIADESVNDATDGTLKEYSETSSSYRRIHVRTQRGKIGSHSGTVDVALSVNHTSTVIVVVSNILSGSKRKCAVVRFNGLRGGTQTSLHVRCLILPPGTYNTTLLERKGGPSPLLNSFTGSKEALSLSPTSFNPEGFTITYVDQHVWPKRKIRSKRNLVGRSNETTNTQLCPCHNCLVTHHIYDPESAHLKFSYNVNSTRDCCSYCTSASLVLFQYKMAENEERCLNLTYTRLVVRRFHQVAKERNVTKGPVDYHNIGSGCYAYRLRPLINPVPIYHGFFWLVAEGEVINMDEWNTTFFLQPHPDHRLDVRWTAPMYPYNFSSYELQLWHSKYYSIKCRGKANQNVTIDLIPERGRIKLISTGHSFYNLSSGWYCARVTPVDDRCPSDGCQPRSSLAKFLSDSDVTIVRTEEPINILVLSLIGLAAGVAALGVLLACVVLRCRLSQGILQVAYTKVNSVTRLKGIQEVLLVWTAAGVDGPYLQPVIHAFKKLLTSYGRCKVYDYLDLRSLPDSQREHLLETPTAWMDSILNQQQMKIIMVGSEGGRRRQLEWMTPGGVGLSVSELTRNLSPHDAILFSYLLRRLQERPDLTADYARVFHVRFSDINDDTAELEGIVSWTRYRIPQHIRSLTLALHGLSSEEVGSGLEEPTAEDMVDLMTALVKHPGIGVISDPGSVNHIQMNNHLSDQRGILPPQDSPSSVHGPTDANVPNFRELNHTPTSKRSKQSTASSAKETEEEQLYSTHKIEECNPQGITSQTPNETPHIHSSSDIGTGPISLPNSNKNTHHLP